MLRPRSSLQDFFSPIQIIKRLSTGALLSALTPLTSPRVDNFLEHSTNAASKEN
jgi:hypothetical protein